MPPRAVASPKKKRSKRKGSDASKAGGLPKKSRAADIAEVPSMVPLVSLGLTGAEAEIDAPRHSGRPNAGTGGRNAQLEKIGSILQSKPRTQEHKGLMSLGPNIPVNPQAPEPHCKGRKNRSKAVPPAYSSLVRDAPDALAKDVIATGPSFTSQQPGGRMLRSVLEMLSLSNELGTPSLSNELGTPSLSNELGTPSLSNELGTPSLSNELGMPLLSNELGMSSLSNELRMPSLSNELGTPSLSNELGMPSLSNELGTLLLRCELGMQLPNSIPRTLSVFLENLDPALCQHDDAIGAQHCLMSLESEGSSDDSSDSDDSDDKDADEEDSGEDDEEEGGANDDTAKSSQAFGWGEAGRRQKEHPGFVEDAPPSQSPVARPLTPEFQFQYSCDEDDVVTQTSLDKTSDPPDISPGLQQQQSQHIETITSKPDDVLQHHHKKNGKPRLPDPDTLQLLNQVSEGDVQPLKNKKSRSLCVFVVDNVVCLTLVGRVSTYERRVSVNICKASLLAVQLRSRYTTI
ncbi:hypothetical protein EV702DRAFT_1046005 [Suillus placidus]|uniref:Uncharacterized protein n=1 Tax=Suillus placidus TaxID=48579 RepID=A0A9P6ZTW8_9AGAM|nr:hypothetical protein EV702DRAFT_1046005 [Suillus placidus]